MAEPAAPKLTSDPALPITARADEIIAAVRDHQVVIVAGETGSGKTTQLPKLALRAGRKKIAHTQPRRIAARSVAERIAEEMGVELGAFVGYQVRFTRQAGRDTALKIMTDGVLLNEITFDRDLRRYDTIIIDEAHERSLNIDFLLGYLKQLLARRPELKVIVTSATIDTERFSKHFDDAPIIEVSGRTYPVEIRYRPLHDDGASDEGEGSAVERDLNEAVVDAVRELRTDGTGDVLVFLSGEREIRDAADALTAADLPHTEIVPLYARLSAAEQHKVFAPHTGTRIVLATNVAETSLTVPGVRYVVDGGTARISRYSARTKVQRLPIEPISQASANQRAGRSGRVAPGIAIRLYSEADYEARPEFTEPEILRTNLASVILQMAQARLGDIADFPFVEAPDSRSINDGLRLLDELGALASGRSGTPKLTKVGHQLARMPIDPRLGRMLIAAAELGVLREVMAIVAGLSIPDPRERPQDKSEQADAAHRRFWSDAVLLGDAAPVEKDRPGDGDFMALWRLWTYLRRQQKALSGNAFRRLCRDEFISYVRWRDWQDLYAQLRDVAVDLGLGHESTQAKQHAERAQPADQPAGGRGRGRGSRRERLDAEPDTVSPNPELVHTAILAGLLSHVGLADVRGVDPNLPARKRVRLGPQEYLGARGAKFAINRGSSLARKPPQLLMAFELVETNRLWARTVAEIEAAQVERVGEHLLKRTYSEPHWSKRRGAAMAVERVTLLGVPIIVGRTVNYARINPEEAREIFIQSALVEGDWETRHHFFARNQQVRAQAAELEERTRRRDIVVDDATLRRFYAERIPADVVSQTHFDRWWREARRRDEHLLDLSLDDLIVAEAADSFDDTAFPDDWIARTPTGEVALPISYTFDPGSGHDGVEIEIPLSVLNQLDADAFTWQVPGQRHELATELIRSLPKALRTHFVPAPDVARKAVAWLEQTPTAGAFPQALGVALRALTGTQVPAEAWDVGRLPSHLRPTFVVLEGAKTVARGDDLAALQQQQGRRLSQRLTREAKAETKTGQETWTFGALAPELRIERGGTTIVGYPALVDEGSTVGAQVFDTAAKATRSHRFGLRRLVSLVIPDPTKSVTARLGRDQLLALSTNPDGTVQSLLADARLASVGALIAREGAAGQVRDEAAFTALKDRVRADHADDMQRTVAFVAEALRWNQQLATALAGLPESPNKRDLTEQIDNLLFPGFVAATPPEQLRHLGRYVHAAVVRAETLRTQPRRDDAGFETIAELEDAYAELCAKQPDGPLPDDVAAVGWALEELRVGLFAQQLGTAGTVSAKRVRKLLAAAG